MVAAPLVAPAPFEARPGFSRRHLLLAWTYDLVTLLAATAGGSVLAIAWMLVRTDRGRFDLAAGDAVIALALTAAAGPAWTAWQWLRLWDEGVTFGHARARFAASEDSTGPSSQYGRRQALALALHPVSLPLWAWLTAACFASGAGVLIAFAIVPLAVALLVGLLTVLSLVLLLVRPAGRPLHVWIARASFGGGR